jgi:monofunctional glycosyltransferase
MDASGVLRVEREEEIRRRHPQERSLRRIEPARRRTMARRIASLAMRLALGLVALTLMLTLVYSVVMPVSTPMLGRWLTGQSVTREAVPLERISPALVRAVFTAEDQKFCMHNGVDWKSLSEVVEDEGGPSRGASTITMQTVKNLYLWPLPAVLRKPLEVPLALWTNLVWSKRRTLEVYLNVAQWGEGVYGIEAASQFYFKKPASRLNAREAAQLAVALPNPIRRSADAPTRRLRGLAGLIMNRARNSAGYFTCVK